MSSNYAQEFFDRELSMIKDDDIKEFASSVLNQAPTYFWTAPSSSTGKYHPEQSNGIGGLVRHSKAVVYFSDILCRAYNIEGVRRDLVLSAAILHDILKYGQPMQKWTTKVHDKDGADYVYRIGKDLNFDLDYLSIICSSISYHMGRWKVGEKAKQFPEEFTLEETIVHLADMVSAGKEVNLDFLQENLIG